jgi:hypothetical protein
MAAACCVLELAASRLVLPKWLWLDLSTEFMELTGVFSLDSMSVGGG